MDLSVKPLSPGKSVIGRCNQDVAAVVPDIATNNS
jgi:hypothetical protein